MKIFRQTAITIVIGLLLVGCKSTNERLQPSPNNIPIDSQAGSLTQINEEALQHMMDGQLFLDQGDFAMAIVELQEAQILEPNVIAIYLSLSECYWHLNKTERALEYLDIATEIEADNIDLLEFKAEIFFRMQKFGKAQEMYQRLVDLNPDVTEYIIALGDMAKIQSNFDEAILHYEEAYSQGDNLMALELAADLSHRIRKFEKAEKYYDKLIDLDTLNVDYLSAISDVKVQLGKAEEAIEAVKKVIDIEGLSIERQIQLGVLYGELDKDIEAIKSFESILDKDSTSATALHFLSTIHRENEEYEKALNYANDFIALHPENPQGYINSALIAFEQENPDQAVQVLNPAAAEFPDEYLIQYLLGLGYYQIKDYKIASVFLDKARQIVPQSRNALHLLAIANDNLENWEISDGIYRQLIDTDSTDAQALNNYAYSLVERGKKLELSKKYAKQAITIEPDQAAYLDTYGWVLFKLGKANEALKYIKKSLEIDGNNAEILEHLGDVYFSLKKYELARDYYKKALKLDPENEQLIEKLSDL